VHPTIDCGDVCELAKHRSSALQGHILAVLQVTLRLLELSQISMPVAMLRNNASAEVATLAKTLAKRWRELAVAALDCATKALERRA